MYEAALKGKPNTAMMAKGGYSELSDAEVKAVVDYMLLKVRYADRGASGSQAAHSGGSASEASRRSEGAPGERRHPRAAIGCRGSDDETGR